MKTGINELSDSLLEVVSENFWAIITIGLQKGYRDDIYSTDEFVSELQIEQDNLIEKHGVHLSCSLTNCLIVLSGQVEPSVELKFINYPKFPLSENDFKFYIKGLIKRLMKRLAQNRVVIRFHNEILMLENDMNIDPRIKTV